MKDYFPSKKTIQEAHQIIQNSIHKTPVLTSKLINELTETSVYFKCENFQKTGSFKIRGANYAISQLTSTQKEKGVITHSSGNFAQAIALAAQKLGVKAFIVMPKNTSKVKIEAVKKYGGLITLSEPTLIERERVTQQIQSKTGATFLHPSNNLDVIIGQATCTLEFLKQQSSLDIILVPVGGGGLLAGTALSNSYFNKNSQVIGAEPTVVNDAFRSLKSGIIETNQTTNTLAEGLKTNLGTINFPIIKKFVNQIICVEEHDIIDAMKLIYERLKIIIEPSSAVPFAALMKEKNQFKKKNIGIILSGGNVNVSQLPF
ncbi:MAG: pyridoxal-phosphate dependent enzyme [Flavobacteriales bacterium]